jgi:hypothetical protein
MHSLRALCANNVKKLDCVRIFHNASHNFSALPKRYIVNCHKSVSGMDRRETTVELVRLRRRGEAAHSQFRDLGARNCTARTVGVLSSVPWNKSNRYGL